MIPRVSTALMLVAWLALCASPAFAQSPVAISAPLLHDLNGIAELRSLFETDRDTVRIVLLLSPT
jgi:hypothetical protein